METRRNGSSLWQILRRPQNKLADELPNSEFVKSENFNKEVLDACLIDAKYEGYLEKQERLIEAMQTLEKKTIPVNLDYKSISHLRAEAKEKLTAFRPATLAQASRIGGITPADIVVIQVHLKKYF